MWPASKLGLGSMLAASGAFCALAAPASPRIIEYSITGTGCTNTAALSTEQGKLVISMPDFYGEISPSTENCDVHLTMTDGLPDKRLAIVSVTGEGVLETSGGVNVTTFTRVFWTGDAGHTVGYFLRRWLE
jgi:hypothetical protein